MDNDKLLVEDRLLATLGNAVVFVDFSLLYCTVHVLDVNTGYYSIYY